MRCEIRRVNEPYNLKLHSHYLKFQSPWKKKKRFSKIANQTYCLQPTPKILDYVEIARAIDQHTSLLCPESQ
jgi:hypothetical protein